MLPSVSPKQCRPSVNLQTICLYVELIFLDNYLYSYVFVLLTPSPQALPMHKCHSLVPRPLPAFQCWMLKSWVWPGYEVTNVAELIIPYLVVCTPPYYPHSNSVFHVCSFCTTSLKLKSSLCYPASHFLYYLSNCGVCLHLIYLSRSHPPLSHVLTLLRLTFSPPVSHISHSHPYHSTDCFMFSLISCAVSPYPQKLLCLLSCIAIPLPISKKKDLLPIKLCSDLLQYVNVRLIKPLPRTATNYTLSRKRIMCGAL